MRPDERSSMKVLDVFTRIESTAVGISGRTRKSSSCSAASV
jgi:hypothetical protein